MKTVLMMLLTVASSFFLTNTALAQNKPLACQEDASAGLNWKNGKWETKTFATEKFILIQTEDNLTRDSAAKALNNDYPNQVFCKSDNFRIGCQDGSGGNLYFDTRTLKGGISQIFGSIFTGSRRDSVTVSTFTCTPF